MKQSHDPTLQTQSTTNPIVQSPYPLLETPPSPPSPSPNPFNSFFFSVQGSSTPPHRPHPPPPPRPPASPVSQQTQTSPPGTRRTVVLRWHPYSRFRDLGFFLEKRTPLVFGLGKRMKEDMAGVLGSAATRRGRGCSSWGHLFVRHLRVLAVRLVVGLLARHLFF